MKKRQILHFGDLTVDLEARQVTRSGEELQLGRLSFDLLAALIQAAPAALSSDDIVQRVWSGEIVSDETVKQRVSLLRRALGQAPGRDYVVTLRGFGYRLGMRPSGATSLESDTSAPDPVPGRLARNVILILVILSLVLLIAVLATAVRQVKRMSSGGEGRPTPYLVLEYADPTSPQGASRDAAAMKSTADVTTSGSARLRRCPRPMVATSRAPEVALSILHLL
ncbi:MAG: winged helix-turn-helix domain-containing protein [Thermoanaerobaculia bacterium]